MPSLLSFRLAAQLRHYMAVWKNSFHKVWQQHPWVKAIGMGFFGVGIGGFLVRAWMAKQTGKAADVAKQQLEESLKIQEKQKTLIDKQRKLLDEHRKSQAEQQTKNNTLNAEKIGLQQQYHQVNNLTGRLRLSLQQERAENEKITAENNQLKNKLSEQQSKVDSLRQQTQSQETQISALEAKFADIKLKLKAKFAAIKLKLVQKEAALASLEQKLDLLKQASLLKDRLASTQVTSVANAVSTATEQQPPPLIEAQTVNHADLEQNAHQGLVIDTSPTTPEPAAGPISPSSALIFSSRRNPSSSSNESLSSSYSNENRSTERVSPLFHKILTSIHNKDPDLSLLKEWLLKGKACIKQFPQNQFTPLHLSVVAGNEAATQLLLEAGFSPNARNEQGDTPAHLAFKFKPINEAIVELLMDYSANFRQADNKGFAVYYYFSTQDNYDSLSPAMIASIERHMELDCQGISNAVVVSDVADKLNERFQLLDDPCVQAKIAVDNCLSFVTKALENKSQKISKDCYKDCYLDKQSIETIRHAYKEAVDSEYARYSSKKDANAYQELEPLLNEMAESKAANRSQEVNSYVYRAIREKFCKYSEFLAIAAQPLSFDNQGKLLDTRDQLSINLCIRLITKIEKKKRANPLTELEKQIIETGDMLSSVTVLENCAKNATMKTAQANEMTPCQKKDIEEEIICDFENNYFPNLQEVQKNLSKLTEKNSQSDETMLPKIVRLLQFYVVEPAARVAQKATDEVSKAARLAFS